MNRSSTVFLLLLLTLASGHAYAGFDHEWALDQNGIWARNYQTGLENGVIALELAGSAPLSLRPSPIYKGATRKS